MGSERVRAWTMTQSRSRPDDRRDAVRATDGVEVAASVCCATCHTGVGPLRDRPHQLAFATRDQKSCLSMITSEGESGASRVKETS
jgi:hypothetical protein